MRTAIVSWHRGGMAHYAAMLTRALAAADPDGGSACFGCEEMNRDLLAPGAELFRFPVPQELRPGEIGRFIQAPGVIRRFESALGDWAPDVIHVNSGHLWYTGILSTLARRYPLVATLHDVRVHPGEWRPYERLKLRPVIRHARKLLVHSEDLREQAARRWGLSPARFVVVPCGLLPTAPPPAVPPPVRPDQVLFAGRIHAYKGLGVLLRAWPAVRAACPSARLVIAGAGRPLWSKRNLRGPDTGIRILNRYLEDAELGRLLAESAVVVLPYLEASQSGMALSAAAYGKPVVASRVGSIPEAVRHGETGLLVEPGDSPALASALLRLLRDGGERGRMGRAAAERGRREFGPEAVGARLLRAYRSAGAGEGK